MKPLSPDAIPRGLSGYMMVIEEPMDEAEKWLITIEAHCSVLDDIPANKELTDAIRSNVVEVRQALAAKDTEIAGLRLLIRGEQTKPPFDVADDQTTEMAVEIAALTADLAARGETIVRLEQLVHDFQAAALMGADPERIKPEDVEREISTLRNLHESEASLSEVHRAVIRSLEKQLIEERWQKDRAEFKLKHTMNGRGDITWCSSCRIDDRQNDWDPRHNWTPDDWRNRAREQWEKERK